MATNVVVKKNGFFSRFFNSIGAIFIGIALVLVCIIGLVWNEGRSVKAIRAYDEVGRKVIDVGNARVNSENDGKLVAITGDISYTPVIDSDYGIEGTFVIRRVVEVYQYKERREGSSTDAETKYYYEGGWYGSYINSASYPENSKNPSWPSALVFENKTFYAEDAMLGDFKLDASQLKKIEPNFMINIPEDAKQDDLANFNITSNRQYITNAKNINSPNIGDIRVSFFVNNATSASAIGMQRGNSIVTYYTSNKSQINRLFTGQMTAQDIVMRLEAENSAGTWVLRIIFMLLICSGFAMVFTPVQVLVSIVPFLGKYIGKGTKFAANVIGGLAGFALSLVVIMIAWIAVRPIVVIPLIIVVGGVVAFVIQSKKKKAAQVSSEQDAVAPA
jgi:hypothetical protein